MREISNSSRATERLGFVIARASAKSWKRQRALVFALDGPLGGGKTTFTRGIFKAFGVRGRGVSPTFILMRRFELRKRGMSLYHVDLYRLKTARAVKALGLREVFASPRHIVAMEWAKRAAGVLPRDAVRISFRHGRTAQERVIIVKQKSHGEPLRK